MRRTVYASHRAALALWMAVAGLALLARPPAGASAADSSAWYWQNPLPRGYALSGSVACVSVTSCVATVADGSIILTADGGAHWTDAPKPTPVSLSSITCPGPTICYGLGAVVTGTGRVEQFVVLKSVDGGKTWQQPAPHLPTSANAYLNGLVCPSVTTCLTAGSGSSTSPLPVFRTGDGGMSWHLVKVPALQGVNALTCVTATICYADGWLPSNGPTPPKSALIRSADGGKTWKMIGKPTTSFGFGALACLRPDACITIDTTCFTCGDDLRELDVTFQQRETESDIYLTRDGGKSWKHVAHVNNSGLWSPICPDATTCYLIADQSVVRTTDGGKTWSVRPLVTFGAYGMACPAPTTCYVAADQTVLKTGDGFDHTEETLAHSGVHTLLTSLNCPSTTACYAMGYGLAATTDGGKTWVDKPAPPDQFGRLSCPSLTVCYAINQSNNEPLVAIYRSDDGAQTWQQMTLPVGAFRPGDIDCVSVTTCYATAALQGTNQLRLALLVTHNGGKTWSAKTGIDAAARAGVSSTGTNFGLDRLSCPSPTTCFVIAIAMSPPTPSTPVSNTILVLSTTDGGKTWAHHVLIPTMPNNNGNLQPGLPLACPTVTTCYAITASVPGLHEPLPGVVLVTTDAGATWRHSVVKAEATLNDISCAGARACRVIGSAGIFATADGGATWQQQRLADGTHFPQLEGGTAFGPPAGIDCPAVDTCYADNGVMIVGTHPPGQPTP
mgnify:CR=1 FL=1